MFKTFRDAWNIPELKKKILFTLFIIIIYRLGAVIPVPFINPEFLSSVNQVQGQSLLTYFSIIGGDAFSKATLFALSISPYITASIVIQLLTVAIPALERLSKEGGEEGRKKIDKITRYVTLGLALVTAFGYYKYLQVTDFNTQSGLKYLLEVPGVNKYFVEIVIIACYCAGAALIMWLAERIDEKGIGNGISVILFINILSSVPNMIYSFYETNKDNIWILTLVGALVVVLIVAVIAFMVFITNSERRIPIQYAKKVVGRKMYGGQSSNLPIKLNMTGVMPIIFSQSIVSIPATIYLIAPGVEGGWWYNFNEKIFSFKSPLYIILFFILIIAFAYFYVAITFDPVEVSNNLKKNGGFVPGIRPGRPTSDYIKKILNKITLIGSIFLGVISIAPLVVNIFQPLGIVAFGGSSLLIVVGVALETSRDLESQMTMRNYKGFLE